MEVLQIFQIVVHWLHVVAAVLWVGATVALSVLVMPVAASLPPEQHRRFGRALAPRLTRFFAIVAGLVMLLGLIRGTVLGPIQSVGVLFGTAYGWTWLAALVITAGLMFIGARFVGPTTERMYADDSLWSAAPGQRPSAGLDAHLQLLRTLGLIEMAGFGVVIVLMVLMRFGL